MIFDDTWIIPERGAPWLKWGFGTRDSVLGNELASVKQVHGARVLPVDHSGVAGAADGLVTGTPGLTLGIKTADCLPVLMADLDHGVVAAVHAGWRGTALGVVRAAVRLMAEKFETKPNSLLVAMGPAIGKCCFEVGAEVACEFAEYDSDLGSITGKCHLDLQKINQDQLELLGVTPGNILRSNYCTVCGGNRFWSYRKDKELAGRMWSVVTLNK